MNSIKEEKLRIPILYLVIPAFIALCIRVIFYLSWTNSTFKYYSFVKGLDMQTLLKWGINSATKGENANNLYVYLISLIVKLANESVLTINIIIILQLFLGIGTVLLSVYIAWLITDSKIVAAVSGILISCYAPLLMYEGFLLKSAVCTFLTTGLLFFNLLFYKSSKYKQISLLCSGVFAGMLLFSNFASLCFVLTAYLWQIFIILKMNLFKRNLYTYPLAILIMLVLLFSATGFRFFPIINNISDKRWLTYVINVGSQKEITTLNESIQNLKEQPSYKTIGIYPYLKKTFSLLSSAEVPDNINYYFVREGIVPLKYMIPPFLLYLIGIPALFIYLALQRDRKISLICGLYFVFLVLPLIIFVPLSRYTVVYSPLLCILSVWLILKLIEYIKQKNIKLFLFFVFLLTISCVIQIKLNPNPFFRASDFIAFANALEIRNPGDSRILYAYGEAYRTDPDSIPIALKYTELLMSQRNFQEALSILEKLHASNPANTVIALQLSSAFLGCKRIDEAGELLNNISGTPIENDPLYLYNKAEYFFQKGNYKEALPLYENLKNLNIPAIQENVNQKILYMKATLIER